MVEDVWWIKTHFGRRCCHGASQWSGRLVFGVWAAPCYIDFISRVVKVIFWVIIKEPQIVLWGESHFLSNIVFLKIWLCAWIRRVSRAHPWSRLVCGPYFVDLHRREACVEAVGWLFMVVFIIIILIVWVAIVEVLSNCGNTVILITFITPIMCHGLL